MSESLIEMSLLLSSSLVVPCDSNLSFSLYISLGVPLSSVWSSILSSVSL